MNSTRPLTPTKLSKELSTFSNIGILVHGIRVVTLPGTHFIHKNAMQLIANNILRTTINKNDDDNSASTLLLNEIDNDSTMACSNDSHWDSVAFKV